MPRSWIEGRRRDPYYRAAQREGLRSRAAFKLVQLEERFHLIRKGDRVLDLGAAPGGWSLVAREFAGAEGEVVAVDVRRVEPAPGIRVVRGRVGDPSLLDRLGPDRFDVLLSDMAPSLSGNYSTDHARSVELVRLAFALAQQVLREDGNFGAKVFQGDMVTDLVRDMGPSFDRFQATKPQASREQSSEIYLVGRGFRARVPREPGLGGPPPDPRGEGDPGK